MNTQIVIKDESGKVVPIWVSTVEKINSRKNKAALYAHKEMSKNQLRQIALAYHNYKNRKKSSPESFIAFFKGEYPRLKKDGMFYSLMLDSNLEERTKVDLKNLENSYICLFDKVDEFKKAGKKTNSVIPLVIERLTKHGGGVAYMDANVTWFSLINYPTELLKYHHSSMPVPESKKSNNPKKKLVTELAKRRIKVREKYEAIIWDMKILVASQATYYREYDRFSPSMKALVDNEDLVDTYLFKACANENKIPIAKNGYLYKILKESGKDKFDIIAYPEKYGVTEKLTFYINAAAILYTIDSKDIHEKLKQRSDINLKEWTELTNE